MNSGAPEWYAVPALLVSSVVLGYAQKCNGLIRLVRFKPISRSLIPNGNTYIISQIQWMCLNRTLLGPTFCVRNRQVFSLYGLNYQRLHKLVIYLKFGLYRSSLYSGFCLERFHWTFKLPVFNFSIFLLWLYLMKVIFRNEACALNNVVV